MTFYELEKECKKRKRNSFLLLMFLIFLMLSIGLSAYYFSFKKDKKIKKTENKKIKKVQKTKKIKKIKKTEILKPIIDLNISVDEAKKKIKKEVNNTKIIKSKKELLNISTLPSFETCITLAKNYYKNGDYENALKWAKNANLQNKNKPESWIIVAKSLYKLNQKQKAIKILKIYYDYTKNKDILNLIERMKNGETF
ncbi:MULTISPECIES: CDC27 family protein [unclassified Lebetimonas]|uniref:CDC27 family protein n=1 Tax=unclassified Lebetimonas TaxID=2648158 RepID=UPI0004638CDE|nr:MULTISPECIES: CDC27 family protein [unclassified Lebetimonas]